MSNLTLLSTKDRKRRFVTSESLLNLKSIITQNITSNNNIEKVNKDNYSDEIETKKQKNLQLFSNRNILLDSLTESNLNNYSYQRTVIPKELNIQNSSKRIVIPRSLLYENEQINIDNQQEVIHFNDNESIIISQSSSHSNLSSNLIDKECSTSLRHIIISSNNHENELESIESIDSSTSNLSNIDDDDSMNKDSKMKFSTNREIIDKSYSSELRTNESSILNQSLISPELFNCCESNQQQSTSIKNNSHTSVLLRETMINISKRLIKIKSLRIVDTHCHFDLIFDRLYIKHNDIKIYFNDYKDFYPSGLSFELAIQVFWRPKHLIKKNWINCYSKYLNDERIYGTCGIHPHYSSSWKQTKSIEDIERCLKHPKIVAIGEIGLDFGPKNTCNIDQQYRVFKEQLKLAVKWVKPIVIHSRDSFEQTFSIMKQYLKPNHKIHLHCFVGTIEDVYLFTSYFTEIKFGFTPIITRKNFLHTVIQQLDLTQILCETDSPYFIPEELSHLSCCAHPSMVYSVIEIIAQIRQLSVYVVACQLRKNAQHIYGV